MAFRGTTNLYGRISELLSNNWTLTPSIKYAAKASNDYDEFSNPSLLDSASVFLSQISSVQTFIKSSSIQAFFCVLTIKPRRMFKSRIVCLVFLLKMIMGGNNSPSVVADKTTRCLFSLPEERSTNPSHLF